MKATSNADARMAASLMAGVLCLVCGACATSTASSKASHARPMAETGETRPESVRITGSYIDQPLEDGVVPLTTSPVHVLTDRDIQRLGVANVAQALRRGVPGSR